QTAPAATPAGAGTAAAQPAPSDPPGAGAGVVTQAEHVDGGPRAEDLRRRLDDVLRQYPPTLREVLRNDPSLLNDQEYLSSYPALAALLRSYPQVARNARFYVGDAHDNRPRDPRAQAIDMWRFTTETFSMV